MIRRAIVECATCGKPGCVVFDDAGKVMNAFFVCKCPRPELEKAKA